MPDWKYLTTELFRSRQALAAYFLRDLPRIYDIGCGPTPLRPYDGWQQVISISPDLPEGAAGVRDVLENVQPALLEARGKYGVSLLGFDMVMPEEGWSRLYRLVRKAQRTVVEVATSYEPARDAAQRLVDKSNARVALRLQLDYSGNDYGNLTDSWPPRPERAFWVLEPTP